MSSTAAPPKQLKKPDGYIILCCTNRNDRNRHLEKWEPLGYGHAYEGEPSPNLLLLRGHATMFSSAEEAQEAWKETRRKEIGTWLNEAIFKLLEVRSCGQQTK